MASERAHFIAELIAALQENEELSSSTSALAPSLGPAPAASAAAAPVRQARAATASGLTSTAFSNESDDANDEDDERAQAAAVFTGFFQESWTSMRTSSASLSVVAASSADEKNAREAHEKLQFDFPQVADAQLLALAESYRNVSHGDSSTVKQTLPVTTTLVEGIVYLNDNSAGSATGTRSSEASGLLAASVLLLLFEHCLRHSDDIRTRALLGKLQVPGSSVSTSTSSNLLNAAPDHSVLPSLTPQEPSGGDGEYVEKYAAEEDPDDMSQVYEGDFPIITEGFGHHLQQKHEASFSNTSGSTFTEKLRLIALRTFSSSFTSISAAKWDEWGIDRCLFGIMEQLLLQERTSEKSEQLFSHDAQGEWTRYLYILRDRILRFPNVSRTGILKLKDLVELLQPRGLRQWNNNSSSRKKALNAPEADHTNAAEEIQLPHHLVYRVLAELVLSKELQQQSPQTGQRDLALALQSLLPLIIQEIQRLGAARQTASTTTAIEESRADESDDLILILIQLAHFLLFASPSKRVTADKLQESGFLRTLLTLVPVDLAAAHVTMSAKRFWFTPLLRLIAECALWNVEFAEYIARVPKFVALLPEVRTAFPAELALLFVALHQHKLHEFAALQALVRDAKSGAAGASLWDVFVCQALFPLACASYLDSMAKVSSTGCCLYDPLRATARCFIS